MSTIALIFNIMFAVYLINFISAFINGLSESFGSRVRIILDIVVGIILFIGVIILND